MMSRYGLSTHQKYPRTPHLPWSLGVTDDDERLLKTEHFSGKEVIVTEKMDGENTSIYTDGVHARSLDSKGHVSRNYVKALQARLAGDLPFDICLCGENLYAVHSIRYIALSDWFLLFGVRNTNDGTYLSWEDVVTFADLLALNTVPVLYKGVWDEGWIRTHCFTGISQCGGEQEGYVVRLAGSFKDFSTSVAKFVRKGHVQTDEHWMHKAVEVNGRL